MPPEQTAYEVLDVAETADAETIKSAYQNRVKETHPDVSDIPDAKREFRRVQTARKILLDASEREVYDRLGHIAYVHQFLSPNEWPGAESLPKPSTSGTSPTASNENTDDGITPPPREPQENTDPNPGGFKSSRSASNHKQRTKRSMAYQHPQTGNDIPWWRTTNEEYRTTDDNDTIPEPPSNQSQNAEPQRETVEDTAEETDWDDETTPPESAVHNKNSFETGTKVQTPVGDIEVNRGTEYIGGLLITYLVFFLSSIILAWFLMQDIPPHSPVLAAVAPFIPILAAIFSVLHLANEFA
ncbi:J domain-containing protein [Salinibaculum rarum]|uniref:J domain-containing protein n=1 Tax=Salinibaculum rarum TaxID=3058903 RepID=UPI00265EEE50|nr:J domain-containing protein [Salinibaculum sp. KK48]